MGIVPCRLAPVFASEILSWRGKLRLSLDLVLPRRRRTGDESLGAFLRRRFGREAVEGFAGPLMAGIYSADPETLSLQATFPHFAAIERHRGSLIRGLRDAGDTGSPTSARVAPAGGMGELVEALVAALGEGGGEGGAVTLTRGRRVVRLERVPAGAGTEAPAPGRGAGAGGAALARSHACCGSAAAHWRLGLDDGDAFCADAVILALPAFAAAALTAPFAPRLAAGLAAIDHVSTATVTLAFREADLPRPLDGYGFVVPAAEGRRITAVTFSSAKFPDRAPAGGALLRVFLGGPGGAALLDRDDADLVAVAREELAAIWGLAAPPRFALLHRHPRATPHYDVGHRDRVAALHSLLPPALHLAGAAYHGLGIPDCITSGRNAADAALA
jgi:oxygen-dependent protoporphyrinogen oxidase